MLNVRILLNQSNLVLVDKAINIRTFLDEAGAEELSLARLELNQDVEDYFDQVVGLVWSTRTLSIVYSSHHFIHEPMDRYQFQNWAGHISYLLKLT